MNIKLKITILKNIAYFIAVFINFILISKSSAACEDGQIVCIMPDDQSKISNGSISNTPSVPFHWTWDSPLGCKPMVTIDTQKMQDWAYQCPQLYPTRCTPENSCSACILGSLPVPRIWQCQPAYSTKRREKITTEEKPKKTSRKVEP